MKRYRLFNYDFDARANILNMEIEESWNEKTKKLWFENKKSIEESLVSEFGTQNKELKINNFKDLGIAFPSVIAFHNKFFRQIRHSFIIGSYYCALTGACALGERILNYLILSLRDFFKNTKEYKEIYDKKSFDDWDKAIDILKAWKILLPNVVSKFRNLKEIRNREAIHFNIETEEKDREIALRAIKILSEIISGQFAFFGKQPWFIEGTKGEFYIKKEWGNNPFIKIVYLPNCYLVGPFYKIEELHGGFKIVDEYNYDDKEIEDSEFIKMRDDFLRR